MAAGGGGGAAEAVEVFVLQDFIPDWKTAPRREKPLVDWVVPEPMRERTSWDADPSTDVDPRPMGQQGLLGIAPPAEPAHYWAGGGGGGGGGSTFAPPPPPPRSFPQPASLPQNGLQHQRHFGSAVYATPLPPPTNLAHYSSTAVGASATSPGAAGLARRPGQPHCQHYMRHGTCKYGAKCRWDHPPLGRYS